MATIVLKIAKVSDIIMWFLSVERERVCVRKGLKMSVEEV